MSEVAQKGDIYSRVTHEIVKAIEAGARDFVMPWHQSSHGGLPRNATTGRQYRGVNTVALWASAQLHGYAHPYWASYQQWQKVGARIRRGERSTIVFFYKREDAKDDDSGERPRALLRYSSVFNAAQVDGWSAPEVSTGDGVAAIDHAEAFVASLGAHVQYGSDLAYYSPKFDRIFMPHRRAFRNTDAGTATEGFYATLFHEHVHWSGHPRRLNRDLTGRFGTSSYAMEELVAELGAAFLCAELGISVVPRKDHAAYVANWLVVLRQQKSAIFTASSTASAACGYLAKLTAGEISDATSSVA